MADIATFEPHWAVPPGATIEALLEKKSLSREHFATALGETVDVVQRLLLGLEKVDDDLASRLSRNLGCSKTFWLNREADYRTDLDRVKSLNDESSLQTWVKQFPVREMASLGWIGSTRSPMEAARECLKFFSVPDVSTWDSRYGSNLAVAAFRMSKGARTSPGAVAAWMRWAELVATRTPSAHWNANLFRNKLADIRRLTWQKDPSTFLPKLRRLCADAGVAVVVARTPTGCPASGVTRFLSPTKALMVLSFRYRSDDQFWFTFFHEAGHLILHGLDATFLEDGSQASSVEEDEANKFAQDILVPPAFARALLEINPSTENVLRFARQIGVSPGIIVGQLQHKKVVGPDRLNSLKRRYDWSQIGADCLIP